MALAHNLRLRAVAEGVETEQQLEFLRRNGCDEAQGYYFSRPLPVAQFEAWLRQNEASAAAASRCEQVELI
ncbi:MAG: EAL domain-containing protein [Rhodospirillales bacterium]|nr:EAL domain-containing protein [Rhodospirillales bacterium]